jgi:hypothetical protein
MTRRNDKLLSILLFASGIFLLNPVAQAQTCTPTVYLFRHAEDIDGSFPTQLTPEGIKHAQLYPSMLEHFQTTQCPLKRVLAMYDVKPDGNPGTTNPRNTAEPLARCCGGKADMSISYLGVTYFLYETRDIAKGGLAAAGSGMHGRIFYALQETLNSQGSVAIFWTQQGMPDVSVALGVPPVNINNDAALSWPGRLRSSVNILLWDGNNYVKVYPFTIQNPPKDRTNIAPVQCFSLDHSTKNVCQNTGFLTDKTKPLGGVFCKAVTSQPGPDNYGYCLGPPPSAHDLDGK